MIHGKFMKWVRMGIFEFIFKSIKDFYLSCNKENIWYAIDANHVKASLSNFLDKNLVDRRKRGIKKNILIGSRGALLAIAVGTENTQNSKFFYEIFTQILQHKNIRILTADSAYNCEKFKKLCSRNNIDFILSTNRCRNNEKCVTSPVYRWIVERTLGWFFLYCLLRIC